MNYRDIPQFTRSSPYSVDIGWGYLESWLESQEKHAQLELDPDFQRHHVWDDTKRTRYIEYILRGGRSSRDIYFNCANYIGSRSLHAKEGPMQLVDGKQRLDAVRKWLRDAIPAFGLHKSDMTGSIRLTGPGFKVHVNDLQTRPEVLQWYLDLNEGGVAHTETELAKVRAMLAAVDGGTV